VALDKKNIYIYIYIYIQVFWDVVLSLSQYFPMFRKTVVIVIFFNFCNKKSGFGGLVVACWPLVTKFAKPSDFKDEKILSTPSFGGEAKPSVPCRRFAACKRSLNGVEVVISAKLPDNISSPQFHLSLLGSLASLWRWRHLATKVETTKSGEK
jgi:hypothetical protein